MFFILFLFSFFCRLWRLEFFFRFLASLLVPSLRFPGPCFPVPGSQSQASLVPSLWLPWFPVSGWGTHFLRLRLTMKALPSDRRSQAGAWERAVGDEGTSGEGNEWASRGADFLVPSLRLAAGSQSLAGNPFPEAPPHNEGSAFGSAFPGWSLGTSSGRRGDEWRGERVGEQRSRLSGSQSQAGCWFPVSGWLLVPSLRLGTHFLRLRLTNEGRAFRSAFPGSSLGTSG